MMSQNRKVWPVWSVVALGAALAGWTLLSGCTPAGTGTGGSQAGGGSAAGTGEGEEHEGEEHEEHGPPPHGGQLIELGDEEYHAELVHDEKAGTVTIYLLDAHAEKAVAIDSADITIKLKHDGEPEQFKLAASPQDDDVEGTASRFVSEEAELAEDLDAEGTEPRLAVTIDGKPYSGKIVHEHDHEGHDHDEHDDHEEE
jgi:hypothetical protein